MTFKEPGRIDWSRGRMGFFITYYNDPHDGKNYKIVLTAEECEKIMPRLSWAVKRSQRPARRGLRKVLTYMLERV